MKTKKTTLLSPAAETGVPLKSNAEYQAAGIYDDIGNLYMDNEAEDGSYLHISRDSQDQITEVFVMPRTQFRELVDRKTYYSFDDGQEDVMVSLNQTDVGHVAENHRSHQPLTAQ